MKPTIVMVHGMFGGGWYWDNYIEYFSQRGYRCINPTLRYHDIEPGAQPDPRLGATGLQDYADDLEAEIKKLAEPPVIMGHSMGGLLAQILGGRGLARALVLLAPAPPSGIMVVQSSVIRTFTELLFKWGFWNKPIEISFERAQYGMMHRMPANEQKYLYNRGVYESGRAAFQIALWFLDTSNSSRIDVAKINCPVLVAVGSEDRVTPAVVVKKVARKYSPYSTYMEFANHAHWLNKEPGWEKIAAKVADWLEQSLNNH